MAIHDMVNISHETFKCVAELYIFTSLAVFLRDGWESQNKKDESLCIKISPKNLQILSGILNHEIKIFKLTNYYIVF